MKEKNKWNEFEEACTYNLVTLNLVYFLSLFLFFYFFSLFSFFHIFCQIFLEQTIGQMFNFNQ